MYDTTIAAKLLKQSEKHDVIGCTGTFMRENAICQHRRDSTYTVPYVPADWICAARDHETRRLAERLCRWNGASSF